MTQLRRKSTPSYQDKEERRSIFLDSMKDLIRFHEIERQEKNNALKFYSAFIAGGIALVLGLTKVPGTSFEVASIKLASITAIIIINYLMIKKLLIARIASNNIYKEYGIRLKYLIEHHRKDLNDRDRREMQVVFKRYYGIPKDPNNLLPKYSSDRHEIYGLWFINLLFSISYLLPLYDYYEFAHKMINFTDIWFKYSYLVAIFLVLETIVCLHGFYIIKNAKNAPGYGSRADEQ